MYFTLKKKNLKLDFSSFNLLLLGITIYSVGNFFYINNRNVCSAITILSFLVIIYAILKIKSFYIPFKGSVKYVYVLFLIWTIITIVRGLISGHEKHSLNPVNIYGLSAFIVPFIVLIGTKKMSLNSVVKFSIISGIIGIAMIALNYKDIFSQTIALQTGEEYQSYLGNIGTQSMLLFNTAFIFMIFYLLKHNYRYITFASVGLFLIVVLFSARRGGIFMILLIIMLTLYLYLFKFKVNSGSMFYKWLFTLSALIFISFLLFYNSNFLLSFLFERLLEDSRTVVESYFYRSFDGNIYDWLFGRGLSGTYKVPAFTVQDRGVIETGYLYLILKGGLLSLILFVFILVNSFFKGFFRSKNILIKAMSLYIVVHIIYLYPFGIPMFNLEYVILWISVAYCQSEYWRSLTSKEIQKKIIKGIV